MAKRVGKYLLIPVVLVVLFLLWWYAPNRLLSGIDTSEIAYIEVQDGNTGKHFEIDNSEYIGYIVRNLKNAELYKQSMSIGHSGYGYKLKFYDGRERMLASFTLNSKSYVRKDPFFYVSSNAALCTDYIAKLADEMIWVPREAPVVSDRMTEEEKIDRMKSVCEKGTFLFSGDTDEGYFYGSSNWIKKASVNDAVVLMYTCDDASHGNWGIIGVGASLGAENLQFELSADIENPTKTEVLIFTVEELMAKWEVTSLEDLEAFYIGAWNGGRIVGLYYLKEDIVKELKECIMTIKATDALIHTYDGRLSNRKASSHAFAVYNYVKDLQGNYVITGQQESTWKDSPDYEVDYILEHTGKQPAIRGFDFMHEDYQGVVDRALEWYEKGGIVTICWHTGTDFASGYNESLKDTLDWENALTPGTPEYMSLIKGIDKVVPYLQQLEEAGVPVLWRPFHELDGTWFWWSKGGPENFVKLWQLMYSRYTDYWELNNLIWVLAYSSKGVEMEEWYPGDSYVDIVGADSFSPGAHYSLYEAARKVAPEGMPIIYHECGKIPTQEELEENGTNWAYFLTWHTDYLTDNRYNPVELLQEIYSSDYYITLDELPDLYE